jgi:hypothetical protein
LDYVVFGIGFGATILVLGLLLRDVGPRLRYRRPGGSDGVLPADLLVAKVSWTRYCHALGAVLAIGGSIFLLTTLVSIVLMLSDGTGGWVMLGALAVLFLLVFYWTWAYFDRFGSYGILPERPASDAAPEPTVVGGEPPRQPALAAEPDSPGEALVYGPPLFSAGISDRSDVPMSERLDDPRPAVFGPMLDEVIDPSEAVAGAEDHARDVPLATPEERLAQMEEPLDHGSAAGDLETAPAGSRPASGRERRMGAAATAGDPEAPRHERDEGSRHGETVNPTPTASEATLDERDEGSRHGETVDGTSEVVAEESVHEQESQRQSAGQERGDPAPNES